MCNYVAYNRFYKRRFLHLLFAGYIRIQNEIRWLQHFVTYHSNSIYKNFFINIIITALTHSVTGSLSLFLNSP